MGLGEDLGDLFDVWDVDGPLRDQEGGVIDGGRGAAYEVEEALLLLVWVDPALLAGLIAVTDPRVNDAARVRVQDVGVSGLLVLVIANRSGDWRDVGHAIEGLGNALSGQPTLRRLLLGVEVRETAVRTLSDRRAGKARKRTALWAFCAPAWVIKQIEVSLGRMGDAYGLLDVAAALAIGRGWVTVLIEVLREAGLGQYEARAQRGLVQGLIGAHHRFRLLRHALG